MKTSDNKIVDSENYFKIGIRLQEFSGRGDKAYFRKKDTKNNSSATWEKKSSYTILVSLGDDTSLILEPFFCFMENMNS